MEPRISQRQSLACRECTRKKRKCSKDIPCARCKRLGLECGREVVRLRRVVNQNSREIAFLDSLRDKLQSGHPARISGALQRLADRVQFLQSGQTQDGHSDGGENPDGGAFSSTAESHVAAQDFPEPSSGERAISNIGITSADGAPDRSQDPPDAQDSLIVTALEHIAWGRNSGGCYPHRRCACQYNVHGPGLYALQQPLQVTFFPVAARVVANHLPARALAEALVHFHLDHIAWHHNCVHTPTFLAQCRRFWDTGACDHPQWLALYLSVLSTAQFCLLHSSKYYSAGSRAGLYASLPADPNAPQSARSMFQAMLDVLHESQYLQNVSMHAVQATAISTEVAHNLGLSQLNATLLAAAVSIAECLGVHKIEDEAPLASGTDAADVDREERLGREVGRRVWLQMIIQDHFAMPFTDAYGIHPQQYATGVPRNCDDDTDNDLVERPDSVPTISSYTRVLGTLARLVPELAAGLGPLRARKPLREQYEHILAMDHKMRQVVVRAIPPFFLRQDPVLEAQVPWLGIARQSMAISAAEKIIMIHRPFLFRSFQTLPAGGPYAHTRRTCVSAAMTILREHRNTTEAGEVSLWTHTAFCITAALLLSFEVLCSRAEGQESTGQDEQVAYRSAIHYARQYLAGRNHDVLAQRGVLLIDTLFPCGPESAPASAANIRFDDIVSKFTAGWAMLGLGTDLHQPQQQANADFPFYDLGASHQTMPSLPPPGAPLPPTIESYEQGFTTPLSPSLEDFDAWFQHIFSTGHGTAFD